MGELSSMKWKILTLAFALLFIILSFSVYALDPTGAAISNEVTSRAPNDTAMSHEAQAGNVTFFDIYGVSTTQTWQGYYGNVTGTIQLADANDKAMYNWSLASPEGEIYASTNATISWSNVQCLNFTANGQGQDESGLGGTVNMNGTNLSTLESMFNIQPDDVDGVSETFTLLHGGIGEHDRFFTASNEFSEGECISTRVFSSAGTGESDKFEEVLLYEPVTASVIFTSLLEEQTVAGFDNSSYDFEMLVLEDGHGTDVDTTSYFFFVELE
jgi:hypothetical protein